METSIEDVNFDLKLLYLLLSATVTSLFVSIIDTDHLATAAQITSAPCSVQLPSNFVLSEDPAAKQLIYQYYQYLNDHNYKGAFSLEDSSNGFPYSFLEAKYKKYESVKVLLLKDVTDKPDFMPWDLSRYYAVKVYYGILDAKSPDPVFQAALDRFSHRRFIVVKLSRDGDWILNMAQRLLVSLRLRGVWRMRLHPGTTTRGFPDATRNYIDFYHTKHYPSKVGNSPIEFMASYKLRRVIRYPVRNIGFRSTIWGQRFGS